MRTFLVTVLSSIAVAAALIAITHIIIISKGVHVTHWKFQTRAPVILLYENINNIVTKYRNLEAIITTGKKTNLFAVVLVSGYSLLNDTTRQHLFKGIDFLINNTSRVILLPVDFSSKMMSLSYLFIKESRVSIRLAQHVFSSKNVTQLLGKYKINMTKELQKLIMNESSRVVKAVVMYGLFLRMQILPYEVYYMHHSLPHGVILEPIFVVCNTDTHVCVACMYERLGIVVQNVKTQVPVLT